jgi:sec-independent protein translocase protein TatA
MSGKRGVNIMGLSTSHLLLVIFAALLLFGAGRLPQVMSDFARGIRAFKKGLSEEDTPPPSALSKDDNTNLNK